jgi:hypothetical protein
VGSIRGFNFGATKSVTKAIAGAVRGGLRPHGRRSSRRAPGAPPDRLWGRCTGQPQCGRSKRTSPAPWRLSVRPFAGQRNATRARVASRACGVQRVLLARERRGRSAGYRVARAPAVRCTGKCWASLSGVAPSCALPPRGADRTRADAWARVASAATGSGHPCRRCTPTHMRAACPAAPGGAALPLQLTRVRRCDARSQERHVVGGEPGVQRRERRQ